jgi:hypothetical protein
VKYKIIDHARDRMAERGVSEAEVVTAIESGTEAQARGDRRYREAVFDYGREWLGRRYEQKKVQVIYVEEDGELIVITVYAFYGSWEGR